MKPAASNDEILEFCNKVREAGGGKPLDALLPGIPEDSQSCLIANNLNFECTVGGPAGEAVTPEDQRILNRAAAYAGWFMSVSDKEVRDKIAESLGLEKVDTHEPYEEGDDMWYSVLLPKKIGNVAANFDQANEEFFSEYEAALENAEMDGLDEKEAHARAWEVASKDLTEAMKRYAKLTTVVEHG